MSKIEKLFPFVLLIDAVLLVIKFQDPAFPIAPWMWWAMYMSLFIALLSQGEWPYLSEDFS